MNTPYTPTRPGTEVLPIGTSVQVNGYYGRITAVRTQVETIDPVTRLSVCVPMRNPVYHVQINPRKVYDRQPQARTIWIRKGHTQLRLFADEFSVIARPAFMDTREVIRRFSSLHSTQPAAPAYRRIASQGVPTP